MLINCNDILDKVCKYTDSTELYTRNGDRVCEYYSGLMIVKSKNIIEIPICAIDKKYFIIDKRNKKELTFSTVDKCIRSILLQTKDDSINNKTAGNFYIDAKNLYIMI